MRTKQLRHKLGVGFRRGGRSIATVSLECAECAKDGGLRHMAEYDDRVEVPEKCLEVCHKISP